MMYRLILAGIALTLLASVVVAQSEDKVYEPSEVTRKAKITLKPQPPYTEKARENEIEGTVILGAVLRANGEVTDIEVVQDLPYGLTEECIKVARKIKFEPALKDERRVSQYIKLSYAFSFFNR